MRTLLKTGFALLMLAFLLIGVSYGMLRAQGVSGVSDPAGRVLDSETRSLATAVRAIELTGPIDMTVRQGAVAALIVRGERRLLGKVDTSVGTDGTLHIGTAGMLLFHRQPLQVSLVLPALENVSVNGSGDSTVTGFSGERIVVRLNGSGNVTFNGHVRQLEARLHGSGDLAINGGASDKVDVALLGSGQLSVAGSCQRFSAKQTGSGDLDARHLDAEEATLQTMGSGDAVLRASRMVRVTLRGSGDVTVYGEPRERSVSRMGSGEVVFR